MSKFSTLCGEVMARYGAPNLALESIEMWRLTEATFDIAADVEYVWKRAFSDIVETYHVDPERTLRHLESIPNAEGRNYPVIHQFSSGELPGQTAKEAHQKSPIILLATYGTGTHYDFKNNEILISLHQGALQLLGSLGLKNQAVIDQYPSIKTEMEPTSIKASIAHELSHWMDDTLHKQGIRAIVSKHQSDTNKAGGDYIKRKNLLTKFQLTSQHEIDAQVHAFVEMKNSVDQETWDQLSFNDLYRKKSNFTHMVERINGLPETDIDDYIRKFMSRLNREGLLGKNMRPEQIFKV